MKLPAIGFGNFAQQEEEPHTEAPIAPATSGEARKCVAQVWFAERNMTLAYFNDAFDLHRGDVVYVDGKLEGLRGRVVSVNYAFHIKPSEYKRVIAVADTRVKGGFAMAGSHLVTFERQTLPFAKALTWYRAPESDDEYVTGEDEESFALNDLDGMKVQPETARRGQDYYAKNRVAYLCVDGTQGRAIVIGTKPYALGFTLENGRVRNLVCDCYCVGTCKHAFAAMLQLKETLAAIEKSHAEEYASSGYFAAVSMGELIAFAMEGREDGRVTLG